MSDRTEEFITTHGDAAYESIWQTAAGDAREGVVILDREGGLAESDILYYGYIDLPSGRIHFAHYSGPGSGDGISDFGPDPVSRHFH